MSQKIPFLQMFAALRQWTELSNGVEGWLIASAAIDKASRSAEIKVEGASGAGPNLVAQAEEALSRAYGLTSVKIEALAPETPSTTILALRLALSIAADTIIQPSTPLDSSVH